MGNEALDGARVFRGEGEPPIPYTNRQLFDAIDWSSNRAKATARTIGDQLRRPLLKA